MNLEDRIAASLRKSSLARSLTDAWTCRLLAAQLARDLLEEDPTLPEQLRRFDVVVPLPRNELEQLVTRLRKVLGV